MIWQSWNDFFKMGGYALYVWGSVIVVFIFMAAEVISLRVRSNTIRAQLSNFRRTAQTSVTASASKEGQK